MRGQPVTLRGHADRRVAVNRFVLRANLPDGVDEARAQTAKGNFEAEDGQGQ